MFNSSSQIMSSEARFYPLQNNMSLPMVPGLQVVYPQDTRSHQALFNFAQEQKVFSMDSYPSPSAFDIRATSWYNHYRIPPQTTPPMTQPTPPTAHSQPAFAETFQHRNSRNELRAEIFENVLSSFPKLQKIFQESTKSQHDGSDNNSCRFQKENSPPVPTPPKTFLFPSMASNVLDDELDPGYFSFTDGMSPRTISSPAGHNIPRYSPVMDLPPNIIQMLDQVMDNTPDLEDLVGQSSPDSKNGILQSPQSPDIIEHNTSVQSQALELTAKKSPTPPRTVKFPCTICNKDFASKANLRVHLRRHSGHKPYSCDWCNKTFNQKSTLRTHVRIHTGERPYKCKYCDKSFADYSTYTKHNRTHTGEKPYCCSICGKTFAQSGNMIRHQQTHKDLAASLKQMSPMINQ